MDSVRFSRRQGMLLTYIHSMYVQYTQHLSGCSLASSQGPNASLALRADGNWDGQSRPVRSPRQDRNQLCQRGNAPTALTRPSNSQLNETASEYYLPQGANGFGTGSPGGAVCTRHLLFASSGTRANESTRRETHPRTDTPQMPNTDR